MTGARGYSEYTAQLRQLTTDAAAGREVQPHRLLASVDGEASEQLRRLVPLAYRRQVGAFFTPAPLKRRVTELLLSQHADSYLDPTCGSGDLLLAASNALPIQNSLDATLRDWTDRLHGCDINREFVEAARHRLFIAALLRHGVSRDKQANSIKTDRYFSNIIVEDGLNRLSKTDLFTGHILLNPPFGVMSSSLSREWTSKPTSTAAIFAYQAIRHLAPEGRLTAILPDVLRSGSRYRPWRTLVDNICARESVMTYGQFDDYADVDVFLLSARVAPLTEDRPSTEWWAHETLPVTGTQIGDYFTVRVGTVVDNRDPTEGPNYPFAKARDLPPSGEVSLPSGRRKFAGRVFEPPFVLLRRTSRPAKPGQSRVSGVLITGKSPVAVDNHLIAVLPKDHSVESCRVLLRVLSSETTSEWLDNRIRCRHLTVGAVRDIPWHNLVNSN
ncbi:N-6 DNA methylase [Streptomyces sp. NPDC093272]|uniref:N-6 DNA methylase n=1 Tax=Streptomyces sp. NPDC093272 TaxID=3154981 RepID=UPI00342D58C0